MDRATKASSDASEATAYVTLWRQRAAQTAAQQFAAAVAAVPPKANERWWVRAARARLTLGLGRARREMGDLGGAREAFERTIADLEPIVRDHHETNIERRLGSARVELAELFRQ